MKIKFALGGLFVALSLATAVPASATNLVTNGSFEQTSLHTSGFLTDTNVAGWTTTSGYTFEVFHGDETDNIGNGVSLYPGSGKHSFAQNPDGFRYIASDGAFEVGTISQTINGLVVGAQYELSFYQAGAQQEGFDGATTDQWKVSLGGDVQYSDLIHDKSHQFSGWAEQTLTFTATSASEVLGFMAVGTPDGEPPFSLLDDVSMVQISSPPPTATPEPSAFVLMIVGLVGVTAARRWYNRRA